jgi:hypothetical protein
VNLLDRKIFAKPNQLLAKALSLLFGEKDSHELFKLVKLSPRGTGVIAAAITFSSLVHVVLLDKVLFPMHRKKISGIQEMKAYTAFFRSSFSSHPLCPPRVDIIGTLILLFVFGERRSLAHQSMSHYTPRINAKEAGNF